jgi:hypothetical protein
MVLFQTNYITYLAVLKGLFGDNLKIQIYGPPLRLTK